MTAIRTSAPPPLRWDGERLHVLDQTVLPGLLAQGAVPWRGLVAGPIGLDELPTEGGPAH